MGEIEDRSLFMEAQRQCLLDLARTMACGIGARAGGDATVVMIIGVDGEPVDGMVCMDHFSVAAGDTMGNVIRLVELELSRMKAFLVKKQTEELSDPFGDPQ